MERDLRMEADGVKAVQWDQIIMRRIDFPATLKP